MPGQVYFEQQQQHQQPPQSQQHDTDSTNVDRFISLLTSQTDNDAFGSDFAPSTLFSDSAFGGSNTGASQASNTFSFNTYNLPPYSTNKMANLQSQNGSSNDFRSLQNSPYYNHSNSGSGNGPSATSPGMSMFQSRDKQQQQGGPFSRPVTNFNQAGNGNSGPFRELFTGQNSSQQSGGGGNAPSVIPFHDRMQYHAIAQKCGFIVGNELERIKENSRRSMNQTYGRISAYFRNRYGETEAKTKASYLQLGVRVPSKDHVSEIVGKGGQKIKLIREDTGALITTPGEHEDHVFIVEAPPDIALRVAEHLAQRAREITQSKQLASEKRRGSAGSNPSSAPSSGYGQIHSISSHGCLMDDLNVAQSSIVHSSMMPMSGSPTNQQPSNGSYDMNSNDQQQQQQQQQQQGGMYQSSASSAHQPPTPNFHSTSASNGANSAAGGGGGRILLARGRISVPQDLVGKIIGTQGSIITTIQKDTGTEIKSPPKEAGRGPNATADFEISAYQGLGLTSTQAAEIRVQQAKQLIGHLVMRQLERRTSDDLVDSLDMPNGGNQAPGSGISSMAPGSNPTMGTFNAANMMDQPQWMWPDVTQMDSNEAREVLDRILAESKNKTRRAKEMAGGSSSTPNTPGGPNSTPGGGSQTPDVFCEAAMNDPMMMHHSNGAASSMLRTMSHPMSGSNTGLNGCYDSGMMEQPSKSGTEIWIQNALQQQQQQQQQSQHQQREQASMSQPNSVQKKLSTASLNLPMFSSSLSRGVAEGCVDYPKASDSWMKNSMGGGKSPAGHHQMDMNQLLERLTIGGHQSGTHSAPENISPPNGGISLSNGSLNGASSNELLSKMQPPGFGNNINNNNNNNGWLAYSSMQEQQQFEVIGKTGGLDFNKNNIPTTYANYAHSAMLEKLFHGSNGSQQGMASKQASFDEDQSQGDIWARTPTDSAATPTATFGNKLLTSSQGMMGAIGEGRRRNNMNQSPGGSDDSSPGEAN